jgi:hypothetical protein
VLVAADADRAGQSDLIVDRRLEVGGQPLRVVDVTADERLVQPVDLEQHRERRSVAITRAETS